MASKSGGYLSFRYKVAKLRDAAEEFIFSVFQADRQARRHPGLTARDLTRGSRRTGEAAESSSSTGGAAGTSTSGAAGGSHGGLLNVVQAAYRHAREVYDSPVTEHLYLTGPAMAPTLNWKGAKDASARERLVVRLLRHPGSNNVLVGDVVAFHSPLALPDDVTHVMVRRVAAVEGDEMVSSSGAEPPFLIPPGHCWVLADNSQLRPEAGEVIDSRSYGHIPFSAVIGRVVYAASSRATHGPVRNNPAHSEVGGEDAAVVAAEVDVERILREEEQMDEFGGIEEGEELEKEGGVGNDDGSGSDGEAGKGKGSEAGGNGEVKGDGIGKAAGYVSGGKGGKGGSDGVKGKAATAGPSGAGKEAGREDGEEGKR